MRSGGRSRNYCATRSRQCAPCARPSRDLPPRQRCRVQRRKPPAPSLCRSIPPSPARRKAVTRRMGTGRVSTTNSRSTSAIPVRFSSLGEFVAEIYRQIHYDNNDRIRQRTASGRSCSWACRVPETGRLTKRLRHSSSKSLTSHSRSDRPRRRS